MTFSKLMKRVTVLFPYLWPSKSRLLQAIACLCFVLMLAGRAVNLLVPETLGDVVDDLTYGRSPWMHIVLYTALRTMQGGQGVLAFFQSTLWIPVAQYCQREMGMMTFDHLLNLSLAFHTRRKTGEILRILDRGSAINGFFQMLAFQLVPVFVDITVAVVYLAVRFDPILAVLMLAVMISYVAASVALTEKRVKYRRKMLDSDKHTDTLMNWEVVKYFTAERFESNRYLEATKVYQANEYQVLLSLQLLNLTQNIIISAGLLAGCFIVAYRVATGQQQVGGFIRFITYLTQLYVPLGALGTLYRIIQQNLVDTENLIKLLEEEQEIKDSPDAQEIQVKGDITSPFSYDGKRTALNSLSFKIPAGTSVALVGESGAGKSSILRLLYRFYDINEGSIKIDGYDLRSLTQHSLRSQIGVVPQDSILFNETVRYNIGYGDPTADEESIVSAAKAAQIHDRVLSFPDGYSTVVGERGIRLSGGEKQRVSIARTILKNPPILLLDEATSALDTHTEREIQSALTELIKGRTTISIAHRLSTVVHSDLILVIQDGTVAEQGTHQELLAKGGLYAALWNKQISAELEVAFKEGGTKAKSLIPREVRDLMGSENTPEGSGNVTPVRPNGHP
ncbi:P-loop containing nucleoside triphosphate hydrolase protein [Atractiella rhizophila]|nr:P-loop containing nucleoside triphosphate hydrolase protein [Atractiella rhizophila]